MRRRILGIDPGKKGGVVLLDRLEVLFARRADGPLGYLTQQAKTDPDPGDMLALWSDVCLVARPDLVIIEAPAWYAGKGGRMPASVAGRSGMEHMAWRMLMACHGVPYEVVPPKIWRKRAGIVVPRGDDPKVATIAKVRAMLPGLELTPGAMRKPHDGLADAAGMALGGAG